jgi:hypothetical protein
MIQHLKRELKINSLKHCLKIVFFERSETN